MEGIKEITDELNKLKPEMQKALDMVNEVKKNTIPNTFKNVKVDGVDCVAQLFEDKVAIVFPSKELLLKYYESLG